MLAAAPRTAHRLRCCIKTKAFGLARHPLVENGPTISLCLTIFPWAKFRRAKGGVKAHVLLDHDDYLLLALVRREFGRRGA